MLQKILAAGAMSDPTEVFCCFLAFESNNVQQKFWFRVDVCFFLEPDNCSSISSTILLDLSTVSLSSSIGPPAFAFAEHGSRQLFQLVANHLVPQGKMLWASEQISSVSGHSTYLPSLRRSWKIKIDKNEIIANANIIRMANDPQLRRGFTNAND